MDESLTRWTIRDAILTFCFEERVEDVTVCEHYFRSQELAEFGYPNLGGASNRGQPTSAEESDRAQIKHELDAAWRGVLLDLKRRIELGMLNPSGFQTRPELQADREPIPNQWAMDFRIEPLESAIVLHEFRFVNVLLERGEPGAASAAVVVSPDRLQVSRIPEMDDDTVLALLEEHTRRVIEDPDARLIGPGKVSVIPLVKGKMQRRAASNELLPVLRDECVWLASWILQKAPHYQVPTAPTIEKMLRSEYWQLRRTSKAAIQ